MSRPATLTISGRLVGVRRRRALFRLCKQALIRCTLLANAEQGIAGSEAQVAQWEKTLQRVMSGQSDAGIDFQALCTMLPHVGYQAWRQHGSHHLYVHPERQENINIQPSKDGKAKPYQVKQVRDLLRKYGV